MLRVQEFIKENVNWRELLSSSPYFIKISDDNMFGRNLVLLKYDQLNSDLGNDIVQECRGLILDSDTFDIVSYPFNKFFNYGESHAATIDWASAYVTQKLDGSIVKVVNMGNGNFLISTNGCIDAFKCEVSNDYGTPFKNFGELVMEGFKFYGITEKDFPTLFADGFTYIFELTSPWNQVVVKWKETKMNLIGVRDNITCKEIFYKDHPLAKVFNTPEIYPIKSIEDCVKAAEKLPKNNEGYVVCDKDFNRIKVKSPLYLQLHYMAGNQVWSPSRVMDIIRANEVSEYLAYFPKFKVAFDELNAKYLDLIRRVDGIKVEIDNLRSSGKITTKKELASWVFSDNDRKSFQGFIFGYFDGKHNTALEWIVGLRTQQILDLIGV